MNDFPLETWLADMRRAIDQIAELGQAVLEKHRAASDEAAHNADRWRLAERLTDERQALLDLLNAVRQIIESNQRCRRAIHPRDLPPEQLAQELTACAEVIEQQLPVIERATITIRQAALDLLQWTARSGKIEGSQAPGDYRASYAQLIAYAPVFNPLLDAFQEELMELSCQPAAPEEVARLVTQVNRHRAVIESTRGFVRSVVEPPLELVFHETQWFLDDVASLADDPISRMASELNDCCQLLLYDRAEFERRVQRLSPALAQGFDASLATLTDRDGLTFVFTVDEDPLFEQLVVTLLRALPEQDLEAGADELSQALYEHFSSNGDDEPWPN